MRTWKRLSIALVLIAALGAQTPPGPQHNAAPAHPPAATPQQPAPQHQDPHAAPAQHPPAAVPQQAPPPAAPTPAAGEAKPAPQTAAPQSTQATAAPSGSTTLNLSGVTLQEVIDILARQLKMNYILDPGLRGNVTINTYGELRGTDLLPLLQTILRMNNAVAVQVGNIWHIVPAKSASRLPISPQVEAKNLPDDERMVLNLIALRYVAAGDIAKVLQNFLGDGAQLVVLDAGNLLLIQDNTRNMRRTLELIGLFDNDTLAKQRVRLFEVKNSQASSLSKELESIFAAYALADKNSAVKFIPIDRVSSLLVVSANPNVFEDVKTWIEKLDQPVAIGGIQNFVYKVQYGLAEQLASTIIMLYGGFGAGYGGGYGGYGNQPEYGVAQNYPGAGGGMYSGAGMGGRGGMRMGGGGGGGGYIQMPAPAVPGGTTAPPPAQTAPQGSQAPGTDRTGTYLGSQAAATPNQAMGIGGAMVRIVPDPVNNIIIVQSTQQEWEVIRKTLAELDIAPRQVLIDAKIYEVDLNDSLTSGVNAFLQQRGTGKQLDTHKLTGGFGDGTIALTMGTLVGHTRELVAFLSASSTFGRSRIISAPSVIATDNLPATINVGAEVPVLTSQGLVGGAQASGTSLFANTISNRNTGVTLAITARVNATGIVTMVINQEVSAAIQPGAGSAIQSPSIQKRTVATQITADDGDTVAIGGIILDSHLYGASRIPFLGKIPLLGAAFGATSISRQKTELIILLTPHVIYDENAMKDTTEELKGRLRGLQKLMKND
jgi:general secretion pathway protein D